MRRYRVLVIGWLLLLPPAGNVRTVGDPSEPLSRWRQIGGFESALACHLAKQERIDGAAGIISRTRDEETRRRQWADAMVYPLALCVPSSDPRLER
jgi:hypothetical protein